MTAGLIALAAVLVLLGGGGLFLYLRGRDKERLRQARNAAEVKDAQLDAAARRPRTDDELAGRMRDRSF